MISGPDGAAQAGRPTTIFLEGRLPLVTPAIARELGLHEGQVVQARAQAQASGWNLQLAGHSLHWPGELPPQWRLAAGDTLLFRVQFQTDGSVLLRPWSPGVSAGAEALLPDRTTQLQYRPPGTAVLSQLLQPASLDQLLQSVQRLAPELAAGFQAWLLQRPAMAQLTPAKLQQLLMQGGWMSEALLAQGRLPDGLDLKTQLRGLLRGLSSQASPLRDLLQDALDDIESRQLRASDPHGRDWAISMVLPFVDAHPVEVKLAWHRNEPEHKRRFTIELYTQSPSLGELWLQSQISNLSRVDLVMWADRQDIAQQAQARSASLAEELDSVGLQLGQLQIIHGRRPQSAEPEWSPPASGSMVDVAT